jgi:hypothetical protein
MLRSKRVALATVVAGFLGVAGVAGANTTGTTPPVLTSAPVLSGSAHQGSTDTLTLGKFSNETSQNGIWYDCPTPGNNPACTKTNPAGGTSYTLQPSDPVGDYLRLDETAVNKTGTSVVWSNVIGPITAAPAANKLAWAPPTNTAPTTVNITTADESAQPYILNLDTTKDYIVNLPSTDYLGALKIVGGHNVTIIGGHITVPNSGNQADNDAASSDQGLLIENSTGTVHVEGVLFDCQSSPITMCDAINVSAPAANIVLENDRANDLWGTYSKAAGGAADTGEHADVIETWGGANSLDVDNFTASGDYQGFTIGPDLYQTRVVNSYDLRNVNLVNEPVPSALASISRGGGKMLLVTSYNNNCTTSGPMSFTNFYLDNESNGDVANGSQTWPTVGSSSACPGVLSGNNESWPALSNITGHVTLAAPPGGDFVPAGVAGTSYVSPGYTS